MNRNRTLAVATIFLLLGLVELLVGLVRAELIGLAAGDLSALLIGWGTFVEVLGGVGTLLGHAELVSNLKSYGSPEALALGQVHLVVALVSWITGWAILAFTLVEPKVDAVLSPAAGKPLHPRLAKYVDFHWGTLGAYGFGFLLSELVFAPRRFAGSGRSGSEPVRCGRGGMARPTARRSLEYADGGGAVWRALRLRRLLPLRRPALRRGRERKLRIGGQLHMCHRRAER